MEEEKVVKSKEPPKDAEEWFDYIREEERKTPERLEDAAKFLATMIAVSLSIFTVLLKRVVYRWLLARSGLRYLPGCFLFYCAHSTDSVN